MRPPRAIRANEGVGLSIKNEPKSKKKKKEDQGCYSKGLINHRSTHVWRIIWKSRLYCVVRVTIPKVKTGFPIKDEPKSKNKRTHKNKELLTVKTSFNRLVVALLQRMDEDETLLHCVSHSRTKLKVGWPSRMSQKKPATRKTRKISQKTNEILLNSKVWI